MNGGFVFGFFRLLGEVENWVAISPPTPPKRFSALAEFGFTASTDKFLETNSVVRMGVPPFRLEILTTIDGVDFPECYAERKIVVIDEVEVSIINLNHLRINKKASGRLKDLNDIEHLRESKA